MHNSYVSHYFVLKFDASCKLSWAKQFSSGVNNRDTMCGAAVDGQGNIYLNGSIQELQKYQSHNYATVKYDANGNQQWVRLYDGVAHSSDEATASAADKAGNVYVTGSSFEWIPPTSNTPANARYDWNTVKYDTNGNQQWVAVHKSDDRHPGALVLDKKGNIYVGGSDQALDNSDYGFTVIKYSPDGEECWVARATHFEPWQPITASLSLDTAGNIYLTGTFIWSGASHIVTIKYTQYMP